MNISPPLEMNVVNTPERETIASVQGSSSTPIIANGLIDLRGKGRHPSQYTYEEEATYVPRQTVGCR